jgi:hypothetical protein
MSEQEVAVVSGGALECTVGVPSGVSCTGSPGDFWNTGVQLWAISAANPVSGPGILMRVYKRLS